MLENKMGEDIAITFETLYDLLMREKQRDELLPLEQSFFQDVIDYLKEKVNVLAKVSRENDLFSVGEKDKVEIEIRNIRKVLKDLYERRERKIVEMALGKSRSGASIDSGALLEEEKRLFDSCVTILNNHRNGVLLNLMQMKLPKIENGREKVVSENSVEDVKENLMIKFMHAVPKFVGRDLTIYGPFAADDIANLPKELAEILVEKNRAEVIKKE
jgi:DNA replication factor GINS